MKNNPPRLAVNIASITVLGLSSDCASFGDAMVGVAAEGNRS